MTRQKTIDLLIYTATGFTIAHGLLSFLIILNHKLFETITFQYSESLTWYFIFFLVPLLAGIAFYLGLKNIYLPRGFRMLLWIILILQLSFTIISSVLNYNYWGYAFRRPTIFNEVFNADKVLSGSKIYTKISTGIASYFVVIDSTELLEGLLGRTNLYYGKIDRIFMAFQDKSSEKPSLNDFPKINQKASKIYLNSVFKQIYESGIIDKGEKDWDTTRQINGIVTEFVTKDKDKYLFAGLSGGQVSNDHYPFYEFLFIEKDNRYKLIKKQRFYTDIAGIEGLEYAIIAPFFSLLLTVIGLIVSIIIITTNRLKSNFIKNHKK